MVSESMTKLLGKKIGMTHIYTEEGKRCPVTVIEIMLSKEEQEQKVEQKQEQDQEQEQGQKQGQGQEAGQIKVGDFVDITGISKGKGFQGGMKRWKWSGTPGSHGSMSHRRIGSAGASTSPGRVLKGKHMPGHMGNKKVTVQNLRVIKLDKENNLLAIKGAVPGHRNTDLIIRKAKKKKQVTS